MNLDRETSLKMFKDILEEILANENGEVGAILVAVNRNNEPSNSARLLGFNLDEDEIYGVLAELTEVLGERIVSEIRDRTLN